MTHFRGYTSRRGWARSKWKALKRLPNQIRCAVRGWWWRASGFAEQLRLRAETAEAASEFQFERARRAVHVASMLQYPPAGDISSLTIAADKVDRNGVNGCDDSWQEHDTGAWNCDRERRGEICWCLVADELRELNKALADGAEFNRGVAEKARQAS